MRGITMRATLVLAIACMASACSKTDETADAPPVAADSAAGPIAAELGTWDMRFDEPAADVGGFQMSEQTGGGWAVKTGANGAAITWRDQDQVQGGALQVSATMEEHSAPAEHREGYGLFVGGQNLKQPDQKYTYFLVRGDGRFLIKRRDGAATPTYADWTASEAIKKVVKEGDVTRNTLEVRVQPDSTRFLVNGTEVKSLPTDQVQPYGVAGLRINHLLDMRVSGFDVQGERAAAGAPPADSAAAATPR